MVRNKISFALPLKFGELVLSKAHKYDTRWIRLTGPEILNFKIKDLLGDIHLVFEGKAGNKRLWIVTHQEEYEQIKLKYRDDLVIHVRQIYRSLGDLEVVQSILVPAAMLGAQVV